MNMVKSISVKDSELYEIVRGATNAGIDIKSVFAEAAKILKEKTTEAIGNDMEVALLASEAEISQKIAELNERAAVVKKLKAQL